ncbi:hypothetical protein EG328_003165 [Venturia inaequalis]|uniref:Uncharacterized protein n=1 Tax=Venturia inaequalis TaxID=5025 RepID=A0A8H3Z0G7_VENIN|nr:hypothetical protein EG328_003165 [Venturia inaequalis]
MKVKKVKKDRGRGRQKATSSYYRDVYDVLELDSDDDDDEDEDNNDEISTPALRRYACSRCRKDGFTCRNTAAGAAFGVPRKSLNERNKELVKENAALKAENTCLAAAAKKWKRKLFELKALYEAEEDDDGEESV